VPANELGAGVAEAGHVALDTAEGASRHAGEVVARLLDRREYPRHPGAYNEWWLAYLAGYVLADEPWAHAVVLEVIARLHDVVMAEARTRLGVDTPFDGGQ
jgi:hypothetical protein